MILQGHTHHHLKSLTIIVCPRFESFPSNGLSAPSLESLRIEKLEKLTSLPGGMNDELPCLTRMDILECPQLEMFSNGRISSSVKLMGLSYRSKLFASLRGALGPNPTLDKLSVYNVDAESFPDEGVLPPSRTSLGRRGRTALKGIQTGVASVHFAPGPTSLLPRPTGLLPRLTDCLFQPKIFSTPE
ncbi:hypothetical protein Fmac_025303 [Flemingia macrophylla]|uniref:Disease resistance protein n=1 Tax=Flemingia macrophylla TaxID=520843 RepID=A0ABD1LRV8_9FABA